VQPLCRAARSKRPELPARLVRRSTLGAALMLTAPGIPMLFQGQEFLQGDWFQDTVPLDWDQSETFRGIVRLYRDLVRLRLNRSGVTRGLTGHGIAVHRIDEEHKLVAFRRWHEGGPGDDVGGGCELQPQGTRGLPDRLPARGPLEAPPQHRLGRLQRGFRRPCQQ
jgi:1,4-alpha-glucan branching enzyme